MVSCCIKRLTSCTQNKMIVTLFAESDYAKKIKAYDAL